ncbi:hypothetical protein NHQ30_005042 [Ciborinia camelliae]|nr:hypothetical protein NHQ30_005042 [Ciborinia camelliae]
MPNAEIENNILVLTALFRQIDVGGHGTIDFKLLAEDIPVNGENAARHRWRRCKNCFTNPPDTPLREADIRNNNLVLNALFKQIKIGRIDFPRLAKDMGVNGENAARHRWKRVLESFGKDKKGKGRDVRKEDEEDGKESDGVTSSPLKVEANTKVARKKIAGSPLKNEVARQGSWMETPKQGGKRKMEDEDLTDEEQGVRMFEMPARKFPKRSATKVIKREQIWTGDDTEVESSDGHDKQEESGSGFEDIDYTKVVTKKRRAKMEQVSDEDWEA